MAILLLIGQAFGGAEQTAPKKTATVEGISEYQLDNGLRLLLYPDDSRAKVTVNMTVLVGSRHEGYGETGMAHLLEHLVFKGTPTHPHVPRALQEHGAQFNGTTSSDRTNYFETLPASDENLEFAIRLEADRLVNSFVRREDLLSEMTVVRNEFERSENSPQSVLMKRIAAAAYDWHNYGKTTIGNRSDIERVPIENLRAFYEKHYQPDNVVLVVAGQFDEARALALVQKYFGSIPRPERKLDRTYTEEPAQDGERLVTLRRVGDVAAIGVAYHIPPAAHEDATALQVLANVLTTEPSGRLHKALVETKKASGVFASAQGTHDPGLMTIGAEVPESGMVDEVRDIILATVEKIGDEGISEEEVNRAKQQILKARELAAADTSQIAISLSNWAAQGDWRLYFLHRDRMEQVTADKVKAAAGRYLKQSNRTVGVFVPTEKPERSPVPAVPDIQALVRDYKGREALAAGEKFDATPENIEARVQRLELPQGIKVSLLPKETRGNEVQVVLTLRYGNEKSLKDLETASGFLAALMLRGTKSLSFQQFRDELDRLGATISSGGGGRGRRGGGSGGAQGSAGSLSFSIQAKRDRLPAVLELLRQVLREPALPIEEFEVMKRERIASLEQMRTEPSVLAGRVLGRQLAPYSKEDIRYVPTIDESIERMKAVTHEQVAQLYREFLSTEAGELAIVGDFDPQACLPILRETFSGWESKQPYERIATPTPDGIEASQHVINTPDKANATYSAGFLIPLRDDDPDYAALVIANYIFGSGALSSRLGNRVRQQDGLSYGISSGLSVSSFDKRAGLSISAICNPQNIGRLKAAIWEEFERLVKDGVTQEELDRAKQGYLRGQKVRRTTDEALAGILTDLSHTGRTMKYYADLEKQIEALTTEQVAAAARKHLDPKKLVIVTAGDFEAKTAASQ
jgi:zinc protease